MKIYKTGVKTTYNNDNKHYFRQQQNGNKSASLTYTTPDSGLTYNTFCPLTQSAYAAKQCKYRHI